MFGGLVHRLQLQSPGPPSPRRRLITRDHIQSSEQREVHSDPEFEESLESPEEIPRACAANRRLLIDKRTVEHSTLLGSKSLGRLDGLKEVQRLAQYEYFESMLIPPEENNDDIWNVSKNKQYSRKNAEEDDLDRIQDLFPNDVLHLRDKDIFTMKTKGLMRKRSSTSTRLARVLSKNELSKPYPTRKFIMESPVQLTSGVQNQDRHLFLFSDALLIAKSRTGGHFKLKDKIRASELWLSRRSLLETAEVTRSTETSFVLGWPTTNVVATFSTQAARDLWWSKLTEIVATERRNEPSSTIIQIVYSDPASHIEYCKAISVGPDATARRCIQLAIGHLAVDPERYQLWAKTPRDHSPYPLIGHERPFAIKLSCLRDTINAEEGFDLDHCNNVHTSDPLAKCQFILRPKNNDGTSPENKKKKYLKKIFRRSLSRGDESSCGVLFGQPLPRVCDGDKLPRPIMALLHIVFTKGPFTQGIFRRSANARLVKEYRSKLDSGELLCWDRIPVLVAAALLKEFARSLPESLLGGLHGTLYSLWLEATHVDDSEKLFRLKRVMEQVPEPNLSFLNYLLCVLHHIARKAATNLMTAANLAVCLGPSLLWEPRLSNSQPSQTHAKTVPGILEILIVRCEFFCGPHVTKLLGEPPERHDSGAEESDSLHSGGLRRGDDSSLDSLERELLDQCPPPPPPPRKDNMSLSRDSGLTMSDSQLYTPDEEESSSSSGSGSGSARALYVPQPNLHNSTTMDLHSKVSTSFSLPVADSSSPRFEYVRVYPGWNERVQRCFQNSYNSVYAQSRGVSSNTNNTSNTASPFHRQDWFRQPSHLKRIYSGGNKIPIVLKADTPKRPLDFQRPYITRNGCILRRSNSDESLLNDHLEAKTYQDNIDSEVIKSPSLYKKNSTQAPPFQEILRSKSVHHLASDSKKSSKSPKASKDPLMRTDLKRARTALKNVPIVSSDDGWSRSRSTPHISSAGDEIERSYDSSTLSDDDSTPHVSRSNSRGKECGGTTTSTTITWEKINSSSTLINTHQDSQILVHAAPIAVHEDIIHDPPPLPPKRLSSEVKLRHLPPVHVDTTPSKEINPNTNVLSKKKVNPPTQVPPVAVERSGRLRQRKLGISWQRSKSLPPPLENSEKSSKNVSSTVCPPPYRPPPPCLANSNMYTVTEHRPRRLDLNPSHRHKSSYEEESYV